MRPVTSPLKTLEKKLGMLIRNVIENPYRHCFVANVSGKVLFIFDTGHGKVTLYASHRWFGPIL